MEKKKLNTNLFLFLACVIFLTYGISKYIYSLDTFESSSETDKTFQQRVSSFMTKNLKYHNELIELNTLKERLLGNRVMRKSDGTYVLSDSGSIIREISKESPEDYYEAIAALKELKTVSEEGGARFLFCAAPNKEKYEKAPANIDNYEKQNYDLFMSELKNAGITALDLSDALEEHQNEFDLYYYTDHHWTARAGFFAHKAILEELERLYGFEYDSYTADIANYNIKLYPDWFLGSYGKKTGLSFSWRGADDFELITPKFYTSLTESKLFIDGVRSGSFEETVIFPDNLTKNYYYINTYATYCGDDYRMQIVKNNDKPDGKKILIVRDSFAYIAAPFLSLQTKELHICDVRTIFYRIGDKINVKDYIEEVKPDYVLVLYSGTPDPNDTRYGFF